MAHLPYFVGRHCTSSRIARVLVTTSNHQDDCLTSVKNRIHGGDSINDPSMLLSVVNIKELLSLLEGFDVRNVPPACVLWMRARIVFPKHQFTNRAANGVRTDEDIAVMSCPAMMESMPCAKIKISDFED